MLSFADVKYGNVDRDQQLADRINGKTRRCLSSEYPQSLIHIRTRTHTRQSFIEETRLVQKGVSAASSYKAWRLKEDIVSCV